MQQAVTRRLQLINFGEGEEVQSWCVIEEDAVDRKKLRYLTVMAKSQPFL